MAKKYRSEALEALHETVAGLRRLGLIDKDFEPINPNDETIQAMKASRRGELFTAGTPERFLEKLNTED